jgi:type I restriction enzyme S subunit
VTSAAWPTTVLGDLIRAGNASLQTGPFGTQLKASSYVDEGTPVVNVRNIGYGRLRPEKLEYLAPADTQRLSAHLLAEGDIVFGRKGAVDRHMYVRASESGWLQGSDCIRLRVNHDVVDTLFLSYSLLDTSHIDWIVGQSGHGATMASLNHDILERVPLRLPDLPIQRRIAQVLGAFDGVIEANIRRMELLERSAHLLFRSWFVDFRFPGSDAAAMSDSPGGPVPSSWLRSPLANVIAVDPRTLVPRDGLKPFVPMQALSERSMLIDGTTRRDGNSGAKFRGGDTLVARITPCLENGKTGYVAFLGPDDVGFGSTEFIVLRSGSVSPEWVYLLARSDRFRDTAIKSMSGASGRQRVRRDVIENLELSVPPGPLIDQFTALVRPTFELVQAISRRNEVLRGIRDLLLPRLITGEVDPNRLRSLVPEALN